MADFVDFEGETFHNVYMEIKIRIIKGTEEILILKNSILTKPVLTFDDLCGKKPFEISAEKEIDHLSLDAGESKIAMTVS